MSNLISILDVGDDMDLLLGSAEQLKSERHISNPPLRDKSLAMIFEKSSTRTRVSFEVGMTDLGGHALYLGAKDMQLGRGETVSDTAKVLSRYVDGIMYRAFSHDMMLELADNSTVPVINGLDDLEHPCQVLADLLTIKEHKGHIAGLKVVYVGDGNNVCNSLMLACLMAGANFIVACPPSRLPDPGLTKMAEGMARSKGLTFEITHDAQTAVIDADVIYTDAWVSMGDDIEEDEKWALFGDYQVNSDMVSKAKPDHLFMHCLPAHRGDEVTSEVIDGTNSVVFDQAENRLHAQKAVMLWLMG